MGTSEPTRRVSQGAGTLPWHLEEEREPRREGVPLGEGAWV